MQIAIHIVVTAIVLVLIGKLLRGFEIGSFFTALITAGILGLIFALMGPVAEQIGRFVGQLVVSMGLAYPIQIAVLYFTMLVINALVLKLAAAIGPGFRISDFTTAMLASLILVLANGLIREANSFAPWYLK